MKCVALSMMLPSCVFSFAVEAHAAGDCLTPAAVLYVDAPGASNGVLESEACAGDELEVTVRLSIALDAQVAVDGFVALVSYDPRVLEILDVTLDGTDSDRFFPESDKQAWTRSWNSALDAFFASACAFPCTGKQERLPPVGDFSLVRARYRVLAPECCSGDVHEDSAVITRVEFAQGTRPPGKAPSWSYLLTGDVLRYPCRQGLELHLNSRPEPELTRGDSNSDRRVDITDAIVVLRNLFQGVADGIACADAADANDDGRVGITDAVTILGYLFQQGPEPPAPFPVAGRDPTPDGISCCP